jgi:hypothetical protein
MSKGRKNYIALYVRKADEEKVLEDLTGFLSIDDLSKRGVTPDILNFSMRFTVVVLNAMGNSAAREEPINTMKKDIRFI